MKQEPGSKVCHKKGWIMSALEFSHLQRLELSIISASVGSCSNVRGGWWSPQTLELKPIIYN